MSDQIAAALIGSAMSFLIATIGYLVVFLVTIGRMNTRIALLEQSVTGNGKKIADLTASLSWATRVAPMDERVR